MSETGSPSRRVMTVLEATVPPEQWRALEQAYQASLSRLPAQMVRTVLVQGLDDRTCWRAISIWHSRAALSEYRQSVELPGFVVMFRAVGAEPALTIYEIAVESAIS